MGVSVPKLVRALREHASQPPDVVVASLADHAAIADLVDHAVARSVAHLIRHDPGVRLGDDPEDVHQLRVATRRLRSDLRTFAALFDPDPVTAIRAELGWLGAQVGAVRDSDVLAMRLTDSVQTLPAADRPGAALLVEHLDRQRTDRAYGHARRSRRPALPANHKQPDRTRRSPSTNRNHHAGRQALGSGRHRPSPTTLDPIGQSGSPHRPRAHRRRTAPNPHPGQTLPYAAEAVSPVIPGAGPFAARVADLQTVLGDHQDRRVVAETLALARALALPPAGVAAGQLIGIERARRAELKVGWQALWRKASAKKLRSWM